MNNIIEIKNLSKTYNSKRNIQTNMGTTTGKGTSTNTGVKQSSTSTDKTCDEKEFITEKKTRHTVKNIEPFMVRIESMQIGDDVYKLADLINVKNSSSYALYSCDTYQPINKNSPTLVRLYWLCSPLRI